MTRSLKHRHPRRYLDAARDGSFDRQRVRVGDSDLAFEFLLNALRLVGGFDEHLLEQRTGIRPEAVETRLRSAMERGLLERCDGHLRATAFGLRFLDDILVEFLPGETATGRELL